MSERNTDFEIEPNRVIGLDLVTKVERVLIVIAFTLSLKC